MTNYIRSGEWHIVHIAVRRNDVTYPCCPGIYYPDVTIYGTLIDFLSSIEIEIHLTVLLTFFFEH